MPVVDVVLWLVDLVEIGRARIRSAGKGHINGARHRDAGQIRWLILDLGKLLCLIDVSKLNPGPSGEDADAVGQPRDVGSPCASARQDWSTSGLYLNSPDKTGLLR